MPLQGATVAGKPVVALAMLRMPDDEADAPDEGDVLLSTPSGEQRRASYEDLLRWNCAMTVGEQECSRAYVEAGGVSQQPLPLQRRCCNSYSDFPADTL